jgi:sulfite reductase beta subunit-like hemoprotein
MEPSASTTETTPKKGRLGSRENPEILENVPGHIIPILEREFDDFDERSEFFLGGGESEEQFIGFRLKQGVYGQRQPDRQMMRIKLPLGGVTPDQMDAFADVAEQFTPLVKGHITTRQNFQFHHIPLRDAAKVLRILGDVGLSSREACGNTVRNVTGDPWAGVCADEPFDITPYGAAFVRHFVRHPDYQLMPRKFKVAFTASDEDRAITLIHDLGFIPRVRDGVKGVEINTGGGTSIMARVGATLYDFVELDNGDYLKVSEAVMRIFNRQDWLRANRARARLKFLVDKVGIDEFRNMVDEELQGEWADERDFDPTPLLFDHDESEYAPGPYVGGSPNGDSRAFDAFVESNVRPQRQPGFNTVEIKVTRGDFTPEQFRGIAQIMRDFCGGYARTTVSQNFVLRWVRDEALYDVWKRLGELDLNDAGADTITDTVSCPGTDSCKLGITASMGLNRAIQAKVESLNITDPLTKKIHIKMSGCPNGCGQHHLGSIGFYGASLKIGGRAMPAYVAHIGGRFEGGDLQYGTRLKVRLPAKRIPDAIEAWIRMYESDRNEGEAFIDFFDRVGTTPFEEAAKGIALPTEFNLESLEHFIDWSRSEPYQVIRGEGECAV